MGCTPTTCGAPKKDPDEKKSLQRHSATYTGSKELYLLDTSVKMPSTLSKTRKQISKKRNGVVNALHEKSRDSLRLHKAGVRDQRIEKLAAARSRKEQPLGM